MIGGWAWLRLCTTHLYWYLVQVFPARLWSYFLSSPIIFVPSSPQLFYTTEDSGENTYLSYLFQNIMAPPSMDRNIMVSPTTDQLTKMSPKVIVYDDLNKTTRVVSRDEVGSSSLFTQIFVPISLTCTQSPNMEKSTS